MAQAVLPYIPEFITVHLGAPNSNAPNVQVSFPEYIKNVASSEIYPTWPESSIRANIYAQISFALNRIYTEWYRSRGYDFDITNSTQYDQKFIQGRDIFDNVSQIVDEIFNNYVRRQGSVEPYFTQFCNGTTVTCDGLSQWGTVELARQGYTPYGILQYYYGDDIDIVRNAPIRAPIESYPGVALRVGMAGNDVKTIQTQLNRIANNYPSIPKIPSTDGIFGESTARSVREFQRIFNLTQDGIVGKSTWYKIKYIFTAVKQLGELASEGLRVEEVTVPYPPTL
ncbi:MAG: peptidoglycan-binding protein, partial [Massilioclostridium sp.]|nr:peptidoglycan-binding protein [Massilioclostridium sp.]